MCLRRGLGVTADADSAELSYRVAGENNHVSAQLALADLIAARAATDEERLEATHWYRLAADNGNVVAKGRLAESQASLNEPTGTGERDHATKLFE